MHIMNENKLVSKEIDVNCLNYYCTVCSSIVLNSKGCLSTDLKKNWVRMWRKIYRSKRRLNIDLKEDLKLNEKSLRRIHNWRHSHRPIWRVRLVIDGQTPLGKLYFYLGQKGANIKIQNQIAWEKLVRTDWEERKMDECNEFAYWLGPQKREKEIVCKIHTHTEIQTKQSEKEIKQETDKYRHTIRKSSRKRERERRERKREGEEIGRKSLFNLMNLFVFFSFRSGLTLALKGNNFISHPMHPLTNNCNQIVQSRTIYGPQI